MGNFDLLHLVSTPTVSSLLEAANIFFSKTSLDQNTFFGREQKIYAHFDEWEITSAYQPIFSFEKKIIAVEALARVSSNRHSIPPNLLFTTERIPNRAIFLDRLVRVLHIANLLRQVPQPSFSIFLNINAFHLTGVKTGHGQFFADMLKIAGLPPEQITLEIVEDAVDDNLLLLEAVNSYRHQGFLIALDDFGAGHSNLDRVWLLEPDVVKLDRLLIQRAVVEPKVRLALPKIVEHLHQMGAMVICEGVEHQLQLSLAQDVGCDWVQGYFLAMPHAVIPCHS